MIDNIDYSINIGQKVVKISGKPFKSGLKVNTVTSMGIHELTQKPVYFFAEDHASVEAFRCELLSVFPEEKQKSLLGFKSKKKVYNSLNI